MLVVLLIVGGLVQLGDCGEERTWNLRQWMEKAPIEAECDEICDYGSCNQLPFVLHCENDNWERQNKGDWNEERYGESK